MNIVCLGDSLTEGYGVSAHINWPGLLNETGEYDVVNKGISGDTTSGMLARLVSEIIPLKPDYLIVLGGTNDVMCMVNDELIIATLVSITRICKHHNITPVVGILPRSYDKSTSENICFKSGQKLNAAIDKLRFKLNAFVKEDKQLSIDFSENLLAKHFESDGVHPTVEGRQIMAATVFKVLEGFYVKSI